MMIPEWSGLRFGAGRILLFFALGCGPGEEPPVVDTAALSQEKFAAETTVEQVLLTELVQHRLWADSLATEVVAVSLVDGELLQCQTLVRKEMGGITLATKGVRPFYFVQVVQARALARLLARLGSSPGALARVSVVSFPPDMSTLPIDRKKAVFFRTLLPLVLYHNAIIEVQRDNLEKLGGDGSPSSERQRRFLAAMVDYYRFEEGGTRADTIQGLLKRVDEIPPALALAQAAIESGWGSSRFCLQGNNLFGQRVWGSDAKGLAPEGLENANFRLLSFPTIGGSIGSYMRNLNTNPAYKNFRRERLRLRLQGKPIEARILASTLEKYSTRGPAYIADVLQIMRQNQMNRFKGAGLASALLPL